MNMTQNLISIIGMALVVLVGCTRLQTQSTDQPIKLRNPVINPVTGDVLAESRGWIYLQHKATASWAKLIPGKCPQWLPDGKLFYYFLDVGYDGCRAQLWSADRNGKDRLRMSTYDYFIRRSPVVSKDGKNLAWHYSTCGASNFVEDIKVVHLESHLHGKNLSPEEKVVLRCPEGTKIESIAWSSDNLLSVIINGQAKEVDTTGKGKEPIP